MIIRTFLNTRKYSKNSLTKSFRIKSYITVFTLDPILLMLNPILYQGLIDQVSCYLNTFLFRKQFL